MTFGPQQYMELQEKLQDELLLSKKEAMALMGFKQRNCVDLNKKIRDNTLNESDQLQVLALDHALAKLPTCEAIPVFRNLKFFPWQIERAFLFFSAHLGKMIRFPDFLSCTKREVFTGNPDDYDFVTQITLNSSTLCRDIHRVWEKYEVRDAEEKVAFTRNTCFEIVKVDRQGYIKLYLQEAPESAAAVRVPKF